MIIEPAGGYTVSREDVSVSIVAEGAGSEPWRWHADGATRKTPFGAETVILAPDRVEQFLTVSRRSGLKTWLWDLDAPGLTAQLTPHGAVEFWTAHGTSSLVLLPPALLDARGRDVSPPGLRWSLDREGTHWQLALRFDDTDLPLPYVIDPAVFKAASTAGNAGATTLVIPVPAGVVADDFLIAAVTVRDNPVITPPAGWTFVRRDPLIGITITQAIYYHVAGASEPANYTWTFSSSQKASGGMIAYSGVDTIVPINAHSGATGSGTALTAPSVVTTVSDATIVGFFGIATNTGITPPSGMAERLEAMSTGGASNTRTTTEAADVIQPIPGPSGNKTATVGAGGAADWVAQLVALKPRVARATTTALNCPASTPANAPAMCTVTVTDVATGMTSPPQGTVDFTLTAQPAGSTATVLPDPCVLATSGLATSSCTTTFTADTVGNYTIQASYVPAPLSLHTASTGSDTISVTARTTSTTLNCPASTPVNSPVTCTATVTDTAPGTQSPPQGTVDFDITTQPAGAIASVAPDPCALVSSGPASSSCTVTFTADTAGSYTVSATYGPAPLSVHGSSIGSDTITVTARATSTTVDCPASTPANSPATCTVTVSDISAGTASPPQGTVDFSITSQPTGATATVAPDPCALAPSGPASSSCTITFTADTIGSYTIQGSYVPGPLSIHAASTGTDTILVTARATSTTLDCPASTPVNSPATCTVTVSDIAAGTASPPQGTVDFDVTSQPAGSAATILPDPCTLVTSGPTSSSCTVTFLADTIGSYTIDASYTPALLSIHGASSGTDTITVIARATSTTVDCPASTPANSPAACTVRVVDIASGTKSAPQGTVDFSITSQPAGATATVTPDPCPLVPDLTTPASDDSTCAFTFTADTIGSYTIQGTYIPAPLSLHAGSSDTDTISVTARATSTVVDCPASTPAGTPATCTVTVTDTSGGTKSAPQGTVDFAFTSQPTGSAPTVTPDPCLLITATTSSSSCTITFQSTTAGSYTIQGTYQPAPASIHAASSGSDTITVLAGPPAIVTVDPPAAENTVNTPHCVTATVTDAFGNPNSGVTVFFTVTGVNVASGTRTTGTDGTTPPFCYTGRLFGPDTIKAVADANGNNQPDATDPFGEGAKLWILPPSTSFCVVDFVTYGVKIVAANGDMGSGGGNARVSESGEPSGQHQYRDHGPVQPMTVHSINVLAVLCSDIDGVPGGKQAQIFGKAKIDGAGEFNYRIDVEDRGEAGTNDRYWITLSNGYDSGDQQLVGGNVKIH